MLGRGLLVLLSGGHTLPPLFSLPAPANHRAGLTATHLLHIIQHVEEASATLLLLTTAITNLNPLHVAASLNLVKVKYMQYGHLN